MAISNLKFSQFIDGGDVVTDTFLVGLYMGQNAHFSMPAFASLATLAGHGVDEGASLIGLQNQTNVVDKTVQDLANASFIAKTDNGTLENAQFLGELQSGILKNTTSTGDLSISVPLTSIDGLTTTADETIYTTASNVYATTPLTPFARQILADTDAAEVLNTLGISLPLTVPNGGTGVTSTLANGVLLGGTTSTNPFQNAGAGVLGRFLTSTGASSVPEWKEGASKYIVGANCTYTTIQSAIDQAILDGVDINNIADILVTTGTYTEDLILKDFVNLSTFDAEDSVKIDGGAVYTSTEVNGSFCARNLTFTNLTNTTPAFSVQGTNTCSLNINNCVFRAVSGTAFDCSNANATTQHSSCKFYAEAGQKILNVSEGSVFKIGCYGSAIDTPSTLINGLVINIFSFETNSYVCTGNCVLSLGYSSVSALGNTAAIDTSSTAFVICVGAVAISINPANYWITGSGTLGLCNMSPVVGTATLIDPAITISPILNEISTIRLISQQESIVMNNNYIQELLDPVNPQDAATKAYVDASGSHFYQNINFVRVSKRNDLPATYDNGVSGVGATLTATDDGASVIDGVALNVGDNILFYAQSSDFENGVYTLTTNGDISSPSIYTRAIFYDEPAEASYGRVITVVEGTQNAGTFYTQNSVVTTIGTDPILFLRDIGDFTNIEGGYLSGVTSPIQSQIDLKAPLNSPTFTGTVTVPTPVNPQDAATKAYVDATAGGSGSSYFYAARARSFSNYSSTYDNGVAGVGATLTSSVNGAVLIDNVVLIVGDVVLFTDQSSPTENGLYYLSTNGTGSTPAIFTRLPGYDTAMGMPYGFTVNIIDGSQHPREIWQQDSRVVTIGTDPVSYEQSIGSFTAYEGAYLSGVTSSIQTQLNAKQVIITGAATTITTVDLTPNKAVVSDGSGKIVVSSVSSSEIGFLAGVSSAIQTQINAKQATITGAATTITSSNLTINRALASDASGKVVISATTSTELGFVSGVTSAIQTQLNAKQATITGGATTITTSNLTASRALVSDVSGKVAVSTVTSTQIGYLAGATSDLQSQIDLKAPKASPTFTGNVTVPTPTLSTDAVTKAYVDGLIGTGSITRVVVRVFNANTTYLPTGSMVYCIVEAVGGGGGGGGAKGSGALFGSGGAGGGGGAYCRKLYNAATIGASKSIVLGTGGTGGTLGTSGNNGGSTTFGALLTVGGGQGGQGMAAGSTTALGVITQYTSGGTTSSGDLNIDGGIGSPGMSAGGAGGVGGQGGLSFFGAGGRGGVGTNGLGSPGNDYGCGGGGGSILGISSANGGNGSNGVIVITEFIS